MSRADEAVPETPPSPLLFSVNLFAFPDVEHLLPGPAHEASSLERTPIPPQLSIDLYPLSEILTGSQDFGLENYGETQRTQQAPAPKRISIGLYSFADTERLSEGVSDVSPTPRTVSINLYPIANIATPLPLPEDITEISPSPTNISIDLHHFPEVDHLLNRSRHQRSTQEVPPVPASHAVALYSINNLFISDTPTSPQPTTSSLVLGLEDSEGSVGELAPTPTLVSAQSLGGATEVEAIASSSLTFIPSINVAEVVSVEQDATTAAKGSEHFQTATPAIAEQIEIVDSSFIAQAGEELRLPEAEQLGIQDSADEEKTPDGKGDDGEEVKRSYEAAERLVASVSSIPFVGAVGEIVGVIVKQYQQMKQHKKLAHSLATKCVEVLITLNEKASWLEITELRWIMDELIGVFMRIQSLIRSWSSYNRVVTFLRKGEIKEGLEKCEFEMQSALDLVQVKINVHRAQAYKLMEEKREEIQENPTSLSESGPEPLSQNLGEPQPSTVGQPDEESSYVPYQRGIVHQYREVEILRLPKLLNSEVECGAYEPIMTGRNADLWMGMWLGQDAVALKALKYVKETNTGARRERLEKEILVWTKLNHEHVLPFYGIVTDLTSQTHLVLPWQEGGNVLEYVRLHSAVDRYSLVTLPHVGDSLVSDPLFQLREAAEGLNYLHAKGIVHGNVKCANILVSKDLAFGDEELPSLPIRWLAPERIEGHPPSKEGDVYSFGMTILELITGKYPYSECAGDAQVKDTVLELKKNPERPGKEGELQDIPDELWAIMVGCWGEAAGRPLMTDLCSVFENSAGWNAFEITSDDFQREGMDSGKDLQFCVNTGSLLNDSQIFPIPKASDAELPPAFYNHPHQGKLKLDDLQDKLLLVYFCSRWGNLNRLQI
ncbi:hypothetical protein CPB83DRAFT_837516 [Crepidotus variabilis]|uniref:Protein kinase domain-containing protein n=1 Tax=Crepidotus variabilis TaxID=179855 RepID=A0A9P6EBE4_9AGAR|nr:hypothetical protein CPB83DRAFT_837516 [Crepidotus variabilis]